MLAKTRRIIEMGGSALDFSTDYPDPSQGYSNAVAELKRLVTRGKELITIQAGAQNTLRTATAQRAELRTVMRRTQMAHIAHVALLAKRKEPQLGGQFRMVREDSPYTVFLSVARSFLTHAEEHREVLVRHGLADTILDGLRTAVQTFDELNRVLVDSQQTQVGATAELRWVGSQILRVVHVLDTLNRYRFAQQIQLLAAWFTSSNVIDPHPAAEESDPAA